VQGREDQLNVSKVDLASLTCSEWLGLDAKGDVDAEFVFGLFENRDHDLGTVVDR
jgi:hypothetical protein